MTTGVIFVDVRKAFDWIHRPEQRKYLDIIG